MAVRASAAIRSPPPLSTPPLSSRVVCCCSLPKPPPLSAALKKHHHHHLSVSFPVASSTLLLAILSPPIEEARAVTLPKDQIVSSITEVEKTIDQVQEATSGLLDSAQRIYQVVAEAVKPGIDAAVPVLQQAGDEALKLASPALSEVSKKAQEAMQSTGLDTESAMSSAAKTVAGASKVIEGAKPIASSAVETVSSSDPIVILATAGVFFFTYLITPPLWSAITFNFRGYKGSLSPAQTLDLISSQNYILIDIRSEKDKDKAGIPRLPSTANNRMVAIPLEELPNKLKGIVRNTKKVEAEIAALKISYLKKINKGSNIVILDSYSDSAKIVARTLTSLGFKKTWIVQDGFSGRKGWLQSRLGTDSYNLSFAEILSPSRIIPARRFGTTKLLPGSE